MYKAYKNALVLGVALFVSIFFVPAVSAAVAISEVQTPFNFLDVGNATPQLKTLWANIVNTGGGTLTFVNVTFIFPFGINPETQGACNATQQRLVGGYASANGTFNLTHQTCTIGYINLSSPVQHNVSLNVTVNMSALAMNHIARGASTVPALIYAVMNSSNQSIVSQTTQHNSTSFWINPRPYAYTQGDPASNGTVYIMGWNQTRDGYIVNVPIQSFNGTLGYLTPASNTFAEIVYMDRTPMEAVANGSTASTPLYMELFSYNLTFRIVAPFASNGSAAQTYYINSPATAGNQTLMPLLIRQETFPGMMGENMTQIMGTPSRSGFSVWYGVNTTNSGIYTDTNLSSIKGVNISYAPEYNNATPMFTITSSNVSALNNTDISILLTLMDTTNSRSGTPVYVQAQQVSGFDMSAPPPLGANITTTYLINISNALDNYTLSNLSIRFMMPKNVTLLNWTADANSRFNITNLDNATFTHSSSKTTYAWSQAWNGVTNYSKYLNITERSPTSNQGMTVGIWLQFVDVVLSSQFNNWIPGNQTANLSFATLNLTSYMSFPTMNTSSSTPGTAGTSNYYNTTVQMPMKGRINMTDKAPGLDSSVTTYTVKIDGQTYTPADGNITIGSLFLNNVDSGSHSISVSYSIPSGAASSGGADAGGGGGAGGAFIIPATVTTSKFDVTKGSSIVVDFGIPKDGNKTERYTIRVVDILGSEITLDIK